MVWRCLAGHSCTQLEIGSFFLSYFPKVSCWYRITWGESWARWGLWRSRNRCSGRTLIKYKRSKTFQWIKLKAHINIRDKLMVQQIQLLPLYTRDTLFMALQPTSCSMNPVSVRNLRIALLLAFHIKNFICLVWAAESIHIFRPFFKLCINTTDKTETDHATGRRFTEWLTVLFLIW